MFTGLLLVGMLGLLGGAEVVCRLLPSGQAPEVKDYIERWSMWSKEEYLEIDRVAEDLWVLRTPESNTDGMRDQNHRVEHSAGTWRIACVGDSVTMGFAVEPEDSYSSALQRSLRRAGEQVEVFNVAVMGWTMRQYRAAYRDIVRKYEVDDVIVGVCLNDIPEMQNNLASGELSGFLSALGARSALVRTLLNAHAREIGDVKELFTEPDSARVRHAWELFEKELLEFGEEVSGDGARLIVVLFPFRFQLEPDAPEPIAQHRLGEFCGRHDIRFHDPLASISRIGVHAFLDYDHFSALGGQVVAGSILGSGLLQRPSVLWR